MFNIGQLSSHIKNFPGPHFNQIVKGKLRIWQPYEKLNEHIHKKVSVYGGYNKNFFVFEMHRIVL